ncbi:lipoprotein BA_5634 family protein [Bacillus mycoides]|uniref:lipoprotein BA_5634 family protein n=1 Tax=Bacillus mycoides TaxID=1405 RepID=UPI003D65B93D
MKKIIGVGLAAAISFGALSGCSLFTKLTGKPNGMIVYGTEEQVQQVADKHKKEAKEKDVYKMKVATIEGKKVLVMNTKTAEELVKKELFKKVENGDSTKAIDKLPAVTAEQGVLFAKNKVESAAIDGTKLKYEGNTIVGDGRRYVDMYAIVADTAYNNVKSEEKSVGVLKFDTDATKKFDNKSVVDYIQTVKIK